MALGNICLHTVLRSAIDEGDAAGDDDYTLDGPLAELDSTDELLNQYCRKAD